MHKGVHNPSRFHWLVTNWSRSYCYTRNCSKLGVASL